ncbi:MAG: NAD(P)H-quinone oxidoreductase [Cyclobacteriaceae bacterium]|nr:NAD(P)H-quinone oxidoreductase [Cyclobacteriaceae bacterium]
MSKVIHGMKAIQQTAFGGTDTLFIGKTDMPVINEEQILIEVHYAALNRADILQRQGKYPPPAGESTILGLEASGVIKETGKNVHGFKVGDPVMALLGGGGQAQYVAVHQNLVMAVPPNTSLEQAAAIPEVFLTAYQALFIEGKTKPNDKVLIHAGASGVGTAAIQLAKSIQCTVITTSSTKKLATCKRLGADLTIDYRNQDFAEEIETFTASDGVNIILDFIGAPYFKQNLECIALDGTLMIISVMGGVKLENVNLYPILQKRVSIKGTTLRSRSITYKKELINAFLNDFEEELATNRILPVIDSVFNWNDIAEAHTYMETNKNKGKVVLKVKA